MQSTASRPPALSAIYAQRLHGRILYVIAPALVAGAIAWTRTGRAASGLVMLAGIGATAAALRLRQFPLHLVPLARMLICLLVPGLGAAIGFLAGQVPTPPVIDASAATAAGLGAMLISLIATLLDDRFATDRPIRIAVIGSSTFTRRLASELADNSIASYEVVGYIHPHEEADGAQRWLGPLSNVREITQSEGVDLLLSDPGNPRLEVFEETAKACLDLPVRMVEATALYENVLGHVPIGAINSAWFQFIMHPRYSPSSPASKRLLDLLVSSVLLLFAAPLLLLCAIAVKIEDRGPVFYRQPRVGEEGNEFEIVKFRTLAPDADERLAAGHSEQSLITRVGRAMRKFHLNELPQLLQVLRGDMSLVGPRPEPPEVVEALQGVVPYYERRALVKPGLTGWAQVRCGYADSHYGTAWKTCHDLYYIKHRSARFDLVILLETVSALIEHEDREEQFPAKEFVLGDSPELARH